MLKHLVLAGALSAALAPMGMTKEGSFGGDFGTPEQEVDVASKGGNFLLNVGPTAERVIPAPSVERLAAMGRWMQAAHPYARGDEEVHK